MTFYTTSYNCLTVDLSFLQDWRVTYCIGHIVRHSLPKHGRGQSAVDILRIQIFIFTIEEQRSGVTPQKVSEGLAHHGEAKYRSILKEKGDVTSLTSQTKESTKYSQTFKPVFIWPYYISCLHHKSSINMIYSSVYPENIFYHAKHQTSNALCESSDATVLARLVAFRYWIDK